MNRPDDLTRRQFLAISGAGVLAGGIPASGARTKGRPNFFLIHHTENQPRIVFSDMHSEGVYTTRFTVPRGTFKYNYFHGHGFELFDLSKDPGGWTNLAGRPEYAEIERELKGLILEQFDPDRIEKDLRESLAERLFHMDSMARTGVDWRYEPEDVP